MLYNAGAADTSRIFTGNDLYRNAGTYFEQGARLRAAMTTSADQGAVRNREMLSIRSKGS